VAVRLIILEQFVDQALDDATSLRVADAAAKALEHVMRDGTAKAIGADLRLRNFRGGPVQFATSSSTGHAAVTIGGGTYALADGGRKRKRDVIRSTRRGKVRGRGPKLSQRPKLAAPSGPRLRVRGSTAPGLNITDTYSPRAFDEAIEAARRAVVEQFAKG
jgi:hypothetical protein